MQPLDPPSNFGPRLKLYGLTPAACDELRRLWPVIEPALRDGIEAFIAAEREMPTVAAVFQAHSEAIRRLETDHLSLLLSGQVDERYALSCRSLCEEEERIGLSPRTRMICGNLVLRAALDAIQRRNRFSGRKVAEAAKVVSLAIAFDIATTITLQLDATTSASEARRRAIDDAIGAFEPAIGAVVDDVKDASAALRMASSAMRDVADETSGRMSAMTQSSGEMTHSVETTAAATEELAGSIAEIRGQSEGSLRSARKAVADAETSSASLRDLAQAAQQIGSVVDLISSIAGQTNLLALNATIEAARAGDAGRGFAVVASEVKALAGETGKATEEISRQIAAIQEATRLSVAQIDAIAATVKNISAFATAIATSVEQQTSATQAISMTVRLAAGNTVRAAEDLQVVGQGIDRNTAAAGDLVAWTDRLSAGAARLETGVDTFFARVRGAG